MRDGRYQVASQITWETFRDRYSTEVPSGLTANTDSKAQFAFDKLEGILAPKRVRDVTAARLSHFQSELRKAGLEESTIAGHLRHLKAALRWAVRIGILAKAPTIEMPKRASKGKLMKGRPVTAEEFERMLAVTACIVGKNRSSNWKRDLRGLWLSGLRLGESLELSWDDESRVHVVMSGKFPMLRIPAAVDKGHKERVLPITPDFAEFLNETPEDRRTDFVFAYTGATGRRYRSRHDVGKTISQIGKRAGVKVDTKRRADGTEKVKFASAHDLRRSFGERWSRQVMPQVLMELMRQTDAAGTAAGTPWPVAVLALCHPALPVARSECEAPKNP